MPCNLYRTLWFNALGYVVYRHCVDTDDDEIRTRQVAIEHKQAVFVTEMAAIDYCAYRNHYIDVNGDDRVPTILWPS